MDLGAPGSGRLGDHVVDGHCPYGFVRAGDLLTLVIVALIGRDVRSCPILRASSTLLPPPKTFEGGFGRAPDSYL
jgi:hypothetical protein